MPDHERLTGTTTTTATQQPGNTPFFGPRAQPDLRLDPVQMAAILQRAEAPVRRWLDNNSGQVGSHNEGDLITLIRRNVLEAASMGEGSIRSILRAWAQEHQVRIPPISMVPLGPQPPLRPATGPGFRWPRLNFSLGDFNVNIQLPSEAVAHLPVSLGGRHQLSFRLSASASGSFSFSAIYDGIPHVRIGLRAGVSATGRAPVSGGLFIETSDQVCQARNRMQLEKSLQDAGKNLKDPLELELSEAKKNESNELLRAAIQNWPALKNTSPDGLRSGFLQRMGHLSRTESQSAWLLRPERLGQDMLLERLPWSISVIKLPWMEEAIQVEW